MAGRSTWPKMRFQHPAPVEAQPSKNGHVHVRLRNPDETKPAGASIRGRLGPLVGVADTKPIPREDPLGFLIEDVARNEILRR